MALPSSLFQKVLEEAAPCEMTDDLVRVSMYEVFTHGCCPNVLFALLSKEEGLAMRPACQDLGVALQRFLGGLFFAWTRPRMFTTGPPLSLWEWQRLWEACYASARLDGADPALLARTEFVREAQLDDPEDVYREHPLSRHLCQIDDSCAFLSDVLRKALSSHTGGVTSVLGPHICSLTRQDTNISAILSLDHQSTWYRDSFCLSFAKNPDTDTVALVRVQSGKVALVKIQTFAGAAFVGYGTGVPGQIQGTPRAWIESQRGQVYFGMDVSDVFALTQARWQNVYFQPMLTRKRVASKSVWVSKRS
jgi:hypothetical protein